MLPSPFSKAARATFSPAFSSQWSLTQSRRRHRVAPVRTLHQYAVAVNPATDFFTSTIPGTSQRTKPVGFDEEPCTLTLSDGYGYASVDIGDRLGPNGEYEIMRKLGWGMYATTWLALDHAAKKYYALKIINEYGTFLESNESPGLQYPRFHECEILFRISNPSRPSKRGANRSLRLVHSFHIERGNARHLCLVLELGGMHLGALRTEIGHHYALPTNLVKSIAKQLCQALDYLHTECKVVHTDLKPSNILLGLGIMEGKRLVKTLMKDFPVQRYPPRRIMGETVEALKSQPLPLPSRSIDDMLSWKFKLTDFGSAQWLGRRSTNIVQPLRLRAPEVVLGRNWDEKIDIWSLGCLTYEFLAGRTLFRARGGPSWSEEDDLLANQLELLSLTQQFPDYFVQNSKYGSRLLEEDGSLRNIPGRVIYPKTLAKALFRNNGAPINVEGSNEERELALAFISRCLNLEPKDRASAKELLRHPWIRNFKVPRKSQINNTSENEVSSSVQWLVDGESIRN